MEGIQIEEYRVGALRDIALIKVHGYVDTNTSPELQKVLGNIIDQGIYQFVVDMVAVHYVSSAGWGVFVGEIRRLQEKGGDLKISQMSAEVNEVFEMLEFHRILSSYDSIEEAVEDFDFYRGVNDAVVTGLYPQNAKAMTNESAFATTDAALATKTASPPSQPLTTPRQNRPNQARDVEESSLPISEKIKKIVLENPNLGTMGIKKMLFSPRFGYTRVRLLKLHKILKSLSLDTKSKRYRYFRSR